MLPQIPCPEWRWVQQVRWMRARLQRDSKTLGQRRLPLPRSSVSAKRNEIIAADKRHVWHPYTPMDAYAASDPIVVARAEGPYFWDENGSRFIDGNASWWTSALG